MSSAISWNLVLAIPFLLAFIAVPLWMSVRRRDRAPDHAAAHQHLTAQRTGVTRTARTPLGRAFGPQAPRAANASRCRPWLTVHRSSSRGCAVRDRSTTAARSTSGCKRPWIASAVAIAGLLLASPGASAARPSPSPAPQSGPSIPTATRSSLRH
jgi:hypothetical protein